MEVGKEVGIEVVWARGEREVGAQGGRRAGRWAGIEEGR